MYDKNIKVSLKLLFKYLNIPTGYDDCISPITILLAWNYVSLSKNM